MTDRPHGRAGTKDGGRFAAKPYAKRDVGFRTVEETERAAGLVAGIVRLAPAAARIVARGRAAFNEPEDDTQYLAAKALLIDTATAVKELPESCRHEHPDMPWDAIAGIRNRLAHTYRAISRDALWETLTVAVPALAAKIAPPR